MDIYLDSNATTAVLPSARAAALAVMADDFGNPSSTHSAGLRSRAVLDGVRAQARRVMGASRGRILFTSGATEGIHTAVLSALSSLRSRFPGAARRPSLLLHGATEHKAVPEALAHWNEILGLGLELAAIPVGRDGRHDLGWLRAHAERAALVCTMAANNETGVISDLDGIAAALQGRDALWMVDSVQALGKLPLRLDDLPIDYAPCSGHKLFAPKGIGLLYVRDGAPFTPIFTGGGQEDGLRAGTENMAGIAALGAVLSAVEDGRTLRSAAQLADFRGQLLGALREAFAGLVLNAPLDCSLPTTLNFSVPGLGSKLLIDLFDAAGLRVSGGSACSAAKAVPSPVLQAMGLPAWQTASAVRLSFDATVAGRTIDEACTRILACGESLRANGLVPAPGVRLTPPALVTRFCVQGRCCYLVADPSNRRCVVIDPLPDLAEALAQWVQCRGYQRVAVLETQAHGAPGWPAGQASIALGAHRLTRLALPGHAGDATAYLLHEGEALPFAFVGDAVPGGALEQAVGPDTLLLPRHDPDNRFASTLRIEQLERDRASTACRGPEEPLDLDRERFERLLAEGPRPLLVDVREPFEQRLGSALALQSRARHRAAPLSAVVNALPDLLAQADTPVVFFCRSGNRSAQAARALRRLGHRQAWSLAGGLALWPEQSAASLQKRM